MKKTDDCIISVVRDDSGSFTYSIRLAFVRVFARPRPHSN